jgi:hypothetical protein
MPPRDVHVSLNATGAACGGVVVGVAPLNLEHDEPA